MKSNNAFGANVESNVGTNIVAPKKKKTFRSASEIGFYESFFVDGARVFRGSLGFYVVCAVVSAAFFWEGIFGNFWTTLLFMFFYVAVVGVARRFAAKRGTIPPSPPREPSDISTASDRIGRIVVVGGIGLVCLLSTLCGVLALTTAIALGDARPPFGLGSWLGTLGAVAVFWLLWGGAFAFGGAAPFAFADERVFPARGERRRRIAEEDDTAEKRKNVTVGCLKYRGDSLREARRRNARTAVFFWVYTFPFVWTYSIYMSAAWLEASATIRQIAFGLVVLQGLAFAFWVAGSVAVDANFRWREVNDDKKKVGIE